MPNSVTGKPRKSNVTKPENSGPRSVLRILGFFEALSGGDDELSLAELSVVLKAPKSSLLTLMRPLVAEGYLSHRKSLYSLGPRMQRLAADIVSAGNFRSLIVPYLEQLSERTHETVYFAVLDYNHSVAVCTEVINSPQALRFDLQVGMTFPLYQTAVGSILLAHQTKKWVDDYLRSTKSKQVRLEEFPLIAPLTRGEVLKRVNEARRTGLAVSLGQWLKEAGAVAAPVYKGDGSLAGAISVAGPADRLESHLDEISEALSDVSALASGLPIPSQT